jgi:TolA-binding protein
MRQLRLIAMLAGTLLPASVSAANKEHEAIQRDIAMIGDELRQLKSTFSNEFTAIKTMVQQSINASDKAQNSVLVLETRMTVGMQSLEKSLAQTVANLNAKVDTMADEFRAIKEESKETNARLVKLSTKLDDIKTAIQLLPSQVNQPAPAPSPVESPKPATAGPQADATKVFEDADRDRLAGRTDLAIQEYREFVKAFPKGERACEAQFRVGELLMKKDDIPNAAAEFDLVIERYDSTCKFQPEARYMKGKAFVKAGQPTAAKDEFRRLAEDYKGTDWERKAKDALKEIGFSAAAPKPAGGARTAKKLRR